MGLEEIQYVQSLKIVETLIAYSIVACNLNCYPGTMNPSIKWKLVRY